MTYPLDGTGIASSNLVAGEVISVNTVGQSAPLYVFLNNPLFYSRGFIIDYTDSNEIVHRLTKGVDYSFEFMIDGVVSNNPIYGVLKIENSTLNGTLSLQYQALGGNWKFNVPRLIQYLRETNYNPRMAYMAVAPYPQMIDTGSNTTILLNSFEALQQVQGLAALVNLAIEVRELPENQKILSNGALIVDGENVAENLGGSGSTTGASPGNVALETGGNLDAMEITLTSMASNQGLATATPYAGTGNASVISALKGLYAAIVGSVNIRALTSADVVSIQGGNSTAVKTDGSATTQPVSAVSLPLPAGAAVETGGNLAAIASHTNTTATQATNTATSTAAVAAVAGTTVDPSYAGSGSTTLLGALKGLYAAFTGTQSTRALSSSTDSITIVPSGTQTVSAPQLPSSLGQKTKAQSVSFTLANDQGDLPVTSAGGALALDTSIQTLITAVKNNVEMNGTVWVDNTVLPPLYYVRRETYIQQAGAYAVSWETLTGSAASPTIGNLVAVGDVEGLLNQTEVFSASAGGTGYSSGDTLIHAFGIDTRTSPAMLAYSFWFNAGPSVPTGQVLTGAPTGGTYAHTTQTVNVASSVLPTNAAQETGGNLATSTTTLLSISSNQGAGADTAYAGSGTSTVIGVLKGIYTAIVGTLNIRALTSATDTVKVEGGNTTAVKTDGSGITQPVSAAALPLPTGAAQESGGNLDTLSTNTTAISSGTGTTSDAAWTGGANPGSIISILKASYAYFSTIATATGATYISTGTGSDAAYAGSGAATVISGLKGIYTAILGIANTSVQAVGDTPASVTGVGFSKTGVMARVTDAVGLPVNVLSDPRSGQAYKTGMGQPKVAAETLIFSSTMSNGEIGSQFTITTQGSGSYSNGTPAGQSDSGTTISTGAAGTSGATFQGVDYITDWPGLGVIARYGIDLSDTGQVGNVREWGRLTSNDGCILRLADTTLYLVVRGNGVDTTIASSAWDVPYVLDTNTHIWTIQQENLGVGVIYLYLDDVLVHTYDYRNGQHSGAGPTFASRPLWFYNYNSTNTTNCTLTVYSAAVSSEGNPRAYMTQLMGNEPAVAVAISPSTPIMIDQNVATVIGGVDRYNVVRKSLIGPTGGALAGDDYTLTPIVLGASTQMGLIDTTGYRSLQLEAIFSIAGTMFVSVSFSNDGTIWQAGIGVNAGGVGTSSGLIGVAGQHLYPISGRYAKIQVGSYTSGQMTIIPVLRGAVGVEGMLTNVSHIGGTQVATAGTGGSFSVGGTVAAGSANSITNPVKVGTVDYAGLVRALQSDLSGNLTITGQLPAGTQYGVYNPKYGPYTQTISSLTSVQSTTAPVLIGGFDPANRAQHARMDPNMNLLVQLGKSTNDERGIGELLMELIAQQRAANYYLYEIMCADRGVRLPDEEPEPLVASYMYAVTNQNPQPS